MKNTALTILLTLAANFSIAQTIIRQPDESVRSLASKTIGENSIMAGESYEFLDSNLSYIIYCEIRSLDSSMGPSKKNDLSDHGFPTFSGERTVTLLNILVSTDSTTYTKYVLDTLDFNPPSYCHLPAFVESVLFVDERSTRGLILFLMRPVRADCSSATYYSILFYDDFKSHIKAGRFSLRSILVYNLAHYLAYDENRLNDIIKTLEERRSKKQ